MKRKTMREFVKEHRQEIDAYTQSPYHNDEERRLFVLNDESLYNWYLTERGYR
jgi:hypothetical protein